MSAEPEVNWRSFNHDAAPAQDVMVWVVEEFYEQGVTIGVFDGYTFRVLPSGSDDCSVSWWAPIQYPPPPRPS